MLKCCKRIIPSHAERACSRELLSTAIQDFKQQQQQQNHVLDHMMEIRDEPARPNPDMTLFDGLFLRQMNRYVLEICTQLGVWFENFCVKF